MATATALTIGAAAVGTAGGVMKYFEGREMQKKAQEAIDNFEWQDLKNNYEDLTVSRMGADLQREEAARNTATSVDALRSGGTRALVGGLGRVQKNNNLMNAQIGASLDQQQKDIDRMVAQDNDRIRDMVETRQSNELAGYGQQLTVGQQMKYGGISDITNSLGMGASIAGASGSAGNVKALANRAVVSSNNAASNVKTGGLGLKSMSELARTI